MPSILETEKAAMAGDHRATLVVVSSLRKYRAATEKLLASLYGGGERDTDAMKNFILESGEADEHLAEWE